MLVKKQRLDLAWRNAAYYHCYNLVELMIEQALQQGVSADKAGSLQAAERLYRSNMFNLYPNSNISAEINNVFRI